MRKSVKAVLYSTLLFPGSGHIYLKKYIPGFILIAAAFLPLYFILSTVVTSSLEISDKIVRGEIPPDLAVLTEVITEQVLGVEAYGFDSAGTVFIVLWLIGIIDSYRLGRLKDKAVEQS
jgi:hypothetical protein